MKTLIIIVAILLVIGLTWSAKTLVKRLRSKELPEGAGCVIYAIIFIILVLCLAIGFSI
jgi:Kef-type K+ transport system membrane component KefB